MGTAHSASVAARAAAAPLRVGDRIQVWWPIDKAWFACQVTAVNDAEGTVIVSYDDGDSETLRMAQERWRRERLPGAPNSHKRPAHGGAHGGGGGGDGNAMAMGAPPPVFPAGAKRRRKRPTFLRQDFVGSDAAALRAVAAANGGGAGGDESEEGAFPAFGSNLARLRARAERRALYGAWRGSSTDGHIDRHILTLALCLRSQRR
jgi:hypothetical protein